MRTARWQSIATWFLLLSYAVGSPAFAVLEFNTGLISGRLSRRLATWGLFVLTVLAIGAVYSHFRINSPLTSIPAFFYVVVQLWYGWRIRETSSLP